MKKLKILLVIIFISVVAITITIGLSQEPPPQSNYTPLTLQEHQDLFDAPENGFHQLLEAMDGMVTPSNTLESELKSLGTSDDVSHEVRTFIARNQVVITTAKEGLEEEYIIAPPFDPAVPALLLGMDGEIRDLARLFIYNGHLQDIDGDRTGMLQSYLDALFLGQSMSNGAMLIHSMISIAIERLALIAIYDSIASLDESQLTLLIEELEKFEENIVPFGEILANEQAIPQPKVNFMAKIILSRVIQPAIDRSRISYNTNRTQVIGTTLRARITLSELQTGRSPNTLADIMNGDEIPIDPVTNNPFQYRNAKVFSEGIRPLTPEATESSPIDGKTVF